VSAVFRHWSFDPFLVVALVVAAVHGRGLRRHLRAVARAGRPTGPWLGQAALFWAGLVVLLISVMSPVDYWSYTYLSLHVVQHILISFIAPPLIVLGAPWVPLLLGLPLGLRRWWGTVLQRTQPRHGNGGQPSWPTATAIRAFLAKPWVPVVGFNIVMVVWHLPGPFDWAESHRWAHIWLGHGSFFVLGVGLWLQVFGSYPFRPVFPPPMRVASLVASNAVMVVVAMSMVMLTHDLYGWYSFRGGAAQQSDQQIAGAILWVCGEITFLPSILYTVMQWLREAEDAAPTAASVHRVAT